MIYVVGKFIIYAAFMSSIVSGVFERVLLGMVTMELKMELRTLLEKS